MKSELPSATHRLPLWSTATPATVEKWPCGVVVPSIVARKVPLGSKTRTTLLPASPTYTRFPEAAMLVGFENWPAPEPGMPAWQLAVQTSLFAMPSVTPQPQAEMKLPLASNLWTRALPLSATYKLPLVGATATPTGVWNGPGPEPWLPKVDSRRRRPAACAVAPRTSVTAPIASATRAMRAGPSRSRHLLPSKIPVRAPLPAGAGTQNGLVEIL